MPQDDLEIYLMSMYIENDNSMYLSRVVTDGVSAASYLAHYDGEEVTLLRGFPNDDQGYVTFIGCWGEQVE